MFRSCSVFSLLKVYPETRLRNLLSCNNSKADHCIFFGALKNLNEFWHAKMFQSSKISGFIQSWLLLIWVSATGSQQNFWMLLMLSVFALRFLSVSLLNLDYDLDSVLCCLPRNFVLVCKYLFWRLLSSKNVQVLFDWWISYKLIVSCFVKHCFPRLNHFALFLASFI